MEVHDITDRILRTEQATLGWVVELHDGCITLKNYNHKQPVFAGWLSYVFTPEKCEKVCDEYIQGGLSNG